MTTRPPLPPFTQETAIQKVRLAEDGWNTRHPDKVCLAYTFDSRWRNRAEFANGREQIVALLKRKWTREQDYRLIKEIWGFRENRIALRFCYEYHDDSGNWFRAYGNELWEFRSQIPLAVGQKARRTSRTERFRSLARLMTSLGGPAVRGPTGSLTAESNNRSRRSHARAGREGQVRTGPCRRSSRTHRCGRPPPDRTT